jgi:hypothetical protein
MTEAEKGVILRELRCDWQGKAESEEAIGASPAGNHALPEPEPDASVSWPTFGPGFLPAHGRH